MGAVLPQIFCTFHIDGCFGGKRGGSEMYCHDLEVMSLNPVGLNLGCIVLLSKSYLIRKYFSKVGAFLPS